MALPFEATIYMERVVYLPAARVAVTLAATEHDVNFTDLKGLDYRDFDLAPSVTLSWLTNYGIELLPGKTDFKTGFRVIFGAPAPAGATLTYLTRVVDNHA